MLHRIEQVAAQLLPAVALAGLSLTASAYDFVNVDPPGGVFTGLSGVNGSGTAVGSTDFSDDSSTSFRYELRTGESTPLPPGPGGLPFGALGINDSGTIVGALGDSDSVQEDSFVDGLLDCPHYTRPEVHDGSIVPSVLMSGHHAEIRRWRLKQALGRTHLRRPDLLEKRGMNAEERTLLEEFLNEFADRGAVYEHP